MSSYLSEGGRNGHIHKREHSLEAPDILWTWLEILPGVTTGSIRPVWMIEQLIRQKASERPVKVPRDNRRSGVLVTSIMN